MATNSEAVPNVEDEAFEPPTYDEAFPALKAEVREPTPITDDFTWQPKFLNRSKCTQVFTVPLEERRFKEMKETQFGEESEQAKICKEIMNKTDVSIEISLAKDQSLTVVIHGKAQDVIKARREVLTRLQTQANIQIKIPREHHRFLLGKSGKKLQDLELATATKIYLPRADENSDIVRIVGTKDGIDKARHEIQIISDEQAKLAFERLPVPKVFHPFVCGPNNSNIKQLMEETGAKINVPPPSVMKDEIVVSGEKEGVMKCKATIMQICEEKRRKCQTVSVEVRKSQHKYIIGPRGAGIAEILANCGVSVEVPALDSSSETITLRGEQDKLGPALTMVYSKANSVVFADVVAPSWLHRFIIGKKGANIRNITEEYTKVHIEFTDGQDKITVEGPPEEVDLAVKALESVVKDLKSRMDFAEVLIDQRFHKHIIGKNGSNITRIKNETGVAIRIPNDSEHSKVIRIEGDPAGVVQAKKELQEMAQRMENEKTKDIIIEQRFHKSIIGAKGEKIREIRDRFNQVQITFPDPGKKSDVVTLRGPKNDVDKAFKYMQKMHEELIESNHQAQVHIFKGFHKNIIGKGGANIRKIRDETDTRIDLPSEISDSDVITITGKKANVEQAKVKIELIQKELANIKEITIEIPHKLHNSIIGAKGRLIRAIMDECGGVIIRFPSEGSTSDKVTIRGPKDDVESAKKQLQELTSEKQMSSFTNEIKAKAQYHKFLIGRGGANIRKVRESTGARIIFPANNDPDQETIVVVGTQDSVNKATKELEALINNLDNIVEIDTNVDPKHHRYFVARRGEVLRQIADEYGGVTVSFPRSGVKSDKVIIKGAKDCVEGAKKKIQDIVADLDAQVTVECIIIQQHHRTVMGASGYNIKEITKNFEVGIKFPDKPTANGAAKPAEAGADEEPLVNGDSGSTDGDGEKTNKKDIIIITGKPENCQQAKDALLALVPITEEMPIPFDFHRFIIGQKGRDVRKMMQDYNVNISIPPMEEKSDIVRISGPKTNVERAKAGLMEKVEQLEKEREDRELQSFELTVEVDPMHHPKIIGRKGLVVKKIREDHGCRIQFPEKGDENQNVITIVGYEDKTHLAKEDILKIVKELEDMVTIEVRVDHRIHPRIIGFKGRAVRKVMDDYQVDIRFPRPEDGDPDIVTITGMDDNVYECQDHLLNLQEEFLQDVIDQEYIKQLQRPPSKQDGDNRGGPPDQRGFVVKDAPWDKTPDTASTEEFPAFGAVVAPKSSHAWGPLKRKN
ncbi:vigilin-like [Haliotis cracherodii]|uniref:vigilin-like n=1 Tax=Haliotis cracherodii TaxID=6455 RepID=UPI0039E9EE61